MEIERLYQLPTTQTKIASMAGVTVQRINAILKNRYVPKRSKEEVEKLKRKYDYDAIADDYKKGLLMREVAKKYKIGDSHVLKILQIKGIQSRGREGIRRGENHPLWKGGKTKDHDGYVVQKEGRTHRLVMEKAVERKLNSWEDVHHVDNNKKNYTLENLVVIPTREHIRFHMFLRHSLQEINRENLEKYCIQESMYFYRFTTEQFRNVCEHFGFKLKNRQARRKICRIKGCGGLNVGYRFCSKHYQRYTAKKRGYWKSSRGRTSTYRGIYLGQVGGLRGARTTVDNPVAQSSITS